MVRISPALIDATVSYWTEGRPHTTEKEKQAATERLRNKYLRKGEQPFLLLVKPIEARAYHDEWAVKLGPIAQNVRLISLDGKVGTVARAETTLDDLLDGTSGVKACLFWVSDVVPERDPSFNVELSNIRYFIKQAARDYYDYEKRQMVRVNRRDWVPASVPRKAMFRFEAGDVNILRLIQDGIPWEEIEERYVKTELRFAKASSYDGVAEFVAQCAVDLIISLLLHAI